MRLKVNDYGLEYTSLKVYIKDSSQTCFDTQFQFKHIAYQSIFLLTQILAIKSDWYMIYEYHPISL